MGLSRSSPDKILYDPIRKCWIKKTPEELVRQGVLKKITEELGFPPSLIAIERDLRSLPHLVHFSGELPQRRIDIVCFGKNKEGSLFPLLLIECKKGPITKAARRQVLGYNSFVGASFVALASPFSLDLISTYIAPSSSLPSYQDLLNLTSW